MKILGIGVDIVENYRIAKSLRNNLFIKRIFSNSEILIAKSIKDKKSYYSKRFAAKEAFTKSIGTGFRNDINFKDISIINDKLGKPSFVINDKIKQIEVLTEASSGKNLHLEHPEDIVLDNGVAGTREAINFLQSLRDMLAGNSTSKVNITTKWDGAPAIFVGINPENKKFFVGTKSVFTKNAKLNYTNADIDKNHPAEGLNKKLKTSLRYLPKLGIKGILQGDMMFTKGDIRTESISGEKFITFTPNTLSQSNLDTSSTLPKIKAVALFARILMPPNSDTVLETSYLHLI